MNEQPSHFQTDVIWTAALRDELGALVPRLRERATGADERAEPDVETWADLARLGLTVAPLPVHQGGRGLLARAQAEVLMDVLRLLGAADLSLARIFEGHANAIALVDRYGGAAQNDALAASIRAGALTAVWGADDAKRLEAERVGDTVLLRGRKVFASGAGFVTRPLVTAATPEGPLLLLLDLAPGTRTDLSGWTAQGMRSSATGTVDLDGLVLPATAIVGGPGDYPRQPYLSGGAWRFCAAHLGAMEQLLALFGEHLKSRGRGEDAYQLQRLAACAAAVGSAGFFVREAARRLADETAEPEAVVAFANLTRMIVERAALDVLEAVHRGVGLAGFLRPHPIERISRDLATYLRQPVPDLAMADAGRAVLAACGTAGQPWWSAP